jgi:hypothetical protein
MLTFTVPEQLRAFLCAHQRIGYAALFQASAEAIKTLAPEPKFLNADTPGFLGVLHTWGRQLQYHPHIHYLVPGGAVSTRDRRWHACSPGFYLPVHALSAIFRAKFRDAMAAQGLLDLIPGALWDIDWNVNCQAVGNGEATLKYLARYVFRVAICDSRIVGFDDTHVSFRYRKVHSNRLRTMRLSVFEFLHRFLQHVLPQGFMKLRTFGFLSPSFAMSRDELKARVEMAHGFAVQASVSAIEVRPPLCCRLCGARLRYRRTILPLRVPPAGGLASIAAMPAPG